MNGYFDAGNRTNNNNSSSINNNNNNNNSSHVLQQQQQVFVKESVVPKGFLLAPSSIFPYAMPPDYQLLPNVSGFPTTTATASTQDHFMPPSVAGSLHPPSLNIFSDNSQLSRKMMQDSTELILSAPKHPQPILTLGDYGNNNNGNSNGLAERNISSSLHQTAAAPLGLRLAFDDERVSSCSASSVMNDSSSPGVLMFLLEDISKQLIQQQQEFQQVLLSQTQQFQQSLEEKRQRHTRALFGSIEEAVSRQFQEKEAELDRVRQQGKELEERAKHVAMEANLWRRKAASNEAIVAALKADLQKALTRNREQCREGCGETEADDATSAIMDENAVRSLSPYNNKAGGTVMIRPCQICRAAEANVLFLPCRHLCSCKHCENSMDRCPLCNSIKSASVEVYLS